jgi:hypothetical protein
LEIPEYTFDEFTDIAISRLLKENIDERNARDIAEKVWDELGSKDIRNVIKVARLATNAEDIPFVISMLKGQNKQSC